MDTFTVRTPQSLGHYVIAKPDWEPNWFQQKMIRLFFGWEWVSTVSEKPQPER